MKTLGGTATAPRKGEPGTVVEVAGTQAGHVAGRGLVGRWPPRQAPPPPPLRVRDRVRRWAPLDENDRHDDPDRDQREEQLLHRAAVVPGAHAGGRRRED